MEGLKVAFVGDGNNVAHSLMFAGAQLGAEVWVATPSGYEPRADAILWARQRAQDTGGSCVIDQRCARSGLRRGCRLHRCVGEHGAGSRGRGAERLFRHYQVNSSLFACAKRDAIFMHCLPAHRGEEVSADVIDSPRSVVFQQAENRLHVQKAILMELMKDVPVGAFEPAKTPELAHA